MRTAALGFPVFAVLTAALIGGCASKDTTTDSATSGVMGARDKLVADVRQCSQRYGYDSNQVQGVAENALAPQELQWRQCAYDAMRVYEQAHPALRSQYDQLIAEDIAMTTAIQQGTMTRSQRRARIEELIAQIRSKEEAEARATAAEQERQMEQIRNVVDSARGFAY
jgi:hypothetical protein